MEKSIETKKVVVSDDFLDIYKNFNVVSQVEKMKQLPKKELYLLLTLCLDKFSNEDVVVRHNILPFKDECLELFELQDDKETTNTELLELVKETGDKYIETDYVIDSKGEKMPDPLGKEDVRDAKINIINDEDNKE